MIDVNRIKFVNLLLGQIIVINMIILVNMRMINILFKNLLV